MRVVNPKDGEVFESDFVDNASAVNRLKDRINVGEFIDTDFPVSLLRANAQASKPGARYFLSPRRVFWLHKLATIGFVSKPQQSSGPINLSAITDMFNSASGKLKYPVINMLISDINLEIKIYLSGYRSRWPKSIIVCSPKYGTGYYGRITSGQFYRGRDCTEQILSFLKAFENDPAGLARAQGHLTGRCCFCDRRLEDESSTQLGYGPRCGKQFGIPHKYVNKPVKRIAPVEEQLELI